MAFSGFLGNSLLDWLIGIAVAIIGFFVIRFLLSFVLKRIGEIANHTKNPIDDLLYQVINSTKIFFLIYISIYLGTRTLTLYTRTNDLLNTAFMIVCWIQVGVWITTAAKYWFIERNREDTNGKDKTTLSAINLVAKIIVWSVIFVLVLDNIPGVEINALITSLGIGGIIAGLAVQNILEDLFSSLTIALDQPFVIGDLIKIGEFTGNVEKIGLKSTRLRSLSGEQLIFSNSDLLNSRLQNFKRLERRRVVITIGVDYSTPSEKLKLIPELIKEIITAKDLITFERAFLSELGDSSINFEFSYFVESSDFQYHVDIKQNILLDVIESLSKHTINLAFPTQTIYLKKD